MKNALSLILLSGMCASTAFSFSPVIPEVRNAAAIAGAMGKGCDAIKNEKDKASCAIAGLKFIEGNPSFANGNYKATSARGVDTACWSVSAFDSAAACYFSGAIHDHFDVWQKCNDHQSSQLRATCYHAILSN